MQESFHTIDQTTSTSGNMNGKKAIIIVSVLVVFFVVAGFLIYKGNKPKGLTEQERQAFIKYTEQYAKEHPGPTLTTKEQQAFIAYVNSGNPETITGSKTKSDSSSKTPTSSTPVLTSDQQQAFINYVNAQAK